MTTIYFERPWALFIIAPVLVLIIILSFKNLLKFRDQFERINYIKKRRLRRFFLTFSRILITGALLIALSAPTTIEEKREQGELRMKIFVDDSRSMELFDKETAQRLKEAIGNSFPITLVGTSEIESSSIGDFLIRNMDKNDHILLISDGQVTKGKELADVLLLAHNLNASINTISLSQTKGDAWVTISSPELSSAGTDTPILITVRKSGSVPTVKLTVSLDGTEWISQDAEFNNQGVYSLPLTKNLPEGSHQIIAKIETKDYFAQNNVYRAVIKVEPKPNVLLLTTSSNPPIINLLNKVFDLDVKSTLPSDLKGYSSIIIDNMKVQDLPPVDRLTKFVTDGRGLFVIGGPSALDRGDYKGTQFENVLPISVGIPKKEKNQTPSIVFAIDISGSSGAQFSSSSQRIVGDVQEDLAISILRGLKNDTKVGVVAFNTKPYIVAEVQEKGKQPDLEEKISSLQTFGGTLIGEGIQQALYMISKESGSKSIILISDGNTQLTGDARATVNAAAANNIRVFTVGVGEGTNEMFMKTLAELGKGSYYRPKETDRIQIVLGAPQDSSKNGSTALQIVDFNDFITKNLLLLGKVTGFNNVIPKSSSKVLVTLNDGRPILTTWRYGLGRVAVLSTDDGSAWAGAILNQDNSPLISRTIFWTVGDPRQAKDSDVLTTRGTVSEPIQVLVKSNQLPKEEGISFIKVDADIYRTSLVSREPGFIKVLGQSIAVNYPEELSKLGVSQD
ncbi:MAG: VWA domain-containing protein, partial [Nanoarchaeota archaeon]